MQTIEQQITNWCYSLGKGGSEKLWMTSPEGKITSWDASLGPQPTSDQLATAPPYTPIPQTVANWKGLAIMRTTPCPVSPAITADAAAIAAINALPSPQNFITMAAYESADFVRTSPTLNTLLTAMGFTDVTIDKLFILADALAL
jgi:hypothetical protein